MRVEEKSDARELLKLSAKGRTLSSRMMHRGSLILMLCILCLFASLCACSHATRNSHENDSVGFASNTLSDSMQPSDPATLLPQATGVIVIDAGHQARGDSSPEPIGPGASETKPKVSDGTTGVATGNPEHAINLAVALKLRDALVARGLTVIMVRESAEVNISNSQRSAIANEAHADLFIRLHCDGVDTSSVQGFSTLVPGYNDYTNAIASESQKAGNIMHPLIIERIGANDRGVRERSDLSGFNWSSVPVVLFEMGFMSNPDEDVKLGTDEYQQLLADAIAEATVSYLEQKQTEE